jgi:hypothetical protein
VKERVLGLIQYWADAFRGKPQLSTVEEVYEDLKTQGVEFPPVDLDQLAPVQTPSRVRTLSLCLFSLPLRLPLSLSPQQGQAPSAPEDPVCHTVVS